MTVPVKAYQDDGSLCNEVYYKDGEYHREDGPAYIRYYENGNIEFETWYRGGNHHRLDGPALMEYYEDGSLKEESWYKHDKPHREDGPSWVQYNRNDTGNKIKRAMWFRLEGVLLGFWDFYDQSSPENQKTLLRVWLPYV
jgi:antitoxin component YwqK of YwqJK toxin-antitoxin module